MMTSTERARILTDKWSDEEHTNCDGYIDDIANTICDAEQAARIEELEVCAKIADDIHAKYANDKNEADFWRAYAANDIAVEIRKRKDQ